MLLSKNLSLEEVIKSDTALKNGIYNYPLNSHLSNLKKVAENIFQPIRDHFKEPIYISSGYRSLALNKLIKGSISSQHLEGKALDIDQDFKNTKVTNLDIFNYIKDNLEFDQLINEFPNKEGNPSWVHVSYNEGKNRKQILKSINLNDRIIYELWTK